MNKRGSTLIECLVSVLLLAIVMVGGMTLFFNADKWMTLAMHKKLATVMANLELEKLKKDGYSNLPASENPIVKDIVVGSLKARTADGLGLTTVVNDIDEPGSAIGVDYKLVQVKIDWKEVDQVDSRSISMSTYIAP